MIVARLPVSGRRLAECISSIRTYCPACSGTLDAGHLSCPHRSSHRVGLYPIYCGGELVERFDSRSLRVEFLRLRHTVGDAKAMKDVSKYTTVVEELIVWPGKRNDMVAHHHRHGLLPEPAAWKYML